MLESYIAWYMTPATYIGGGQDCWKFVLYYYGLHYFTLHLCLFLLLYLQIASKKLTSGLQMV